MKFAEFREWAWDCHGYRLNPINDSEARRACWVTDGFRQGQVQAGTGRGNPAPYGPLQQRRLAIWLRTRGLIDKLNVTDWVRAGEDHDDGWLVNDGTGIRWIANPEDEWKDLLGRGFVAVKCGKDSG